MRKNHYLFTLLPAACMMLANCSNNDEITRPAIIVTPAADRVANLMAGEKTLYDVKVTTEKAPVSSVRISSFDPQNGVNSLYDTICSSTEVTFRYVFTAPLLNRQKTEVKLTFEATDSEGNQTSIGRTVNVKNQTGTITEQTGIILHMPGSGLPDALILSDASRPFILAESPRPDTADVYLHIDPVLKTPALRSNTQTKFIRANNFNYSNTTALSISAVYSGSIPSDHVPDLKINDIIIVGHSAVAEGVFQVADFRGENTPEGHVRLNYKAIGSTN